MLERPAHKKKMGRQPGGVPSGAAIVSPIGRTMPAPLWNGKPTHAHKGVLPLLGGPENAHDGLVGLEGSRVHIPRRYPPFPVRTRPTDSA